LFGTNDLEQAPRANTVPNFLKRIIFIWHGKLFREISFSLLQKPRDDDIIHREEEKKKKKRKK